MIWWLEALGLLARSRSRTLLLVLCWTLALTLSGALGWAWRNSPALREAWTRRVPAECYLERADGGTLDGLRTQLSRSRSLEWAGLLSPERAAEEFRAGFELDVVALLGENPFPATVLLRVRPDATLESLDRDLVELRALPGISGVHVERELLGELGQGLRRAGLVALGVLTLFILLTAALLAAALRSLQRAWAGEARLLTLQGAGASTLVLPIFLALSLPALAAVGVSWLLLGLLAELPLRVGLTTQGPPWWPVLTGGLLPLAVGLLVLVQQARRRVLRGD